MSSSSSGGVDAKTKALDIISIVMASLSALSCFIVIALGLAIPRLRGFKSRLVIYLSVMDAGSAVAKLVGIASHGYQTPLCQAMGYFDETFSLMSVTWSSVIAITLFLMVVCGFVPYTRWWFKDWLMVLVVALCVFAFGIIPFFTLGYGSEGASWCWILGSNAFLFFYPILWVSFFVTLVMYCLVFRHLASKYKARHNKRVAGSFDAGGSLLTSETKETLLMLAPFPIVLCAVWTFPTIHRIYREITGGDDLFGLQLLHSFTDPACGFWNSLVYGITYLSEIKSALLLGQCISGKAQEVAIAGSGNEITPSTVEVELQHNT